MKNLRAIAKCTSNEFLISALKCTKTTSYISTDSWRFSCTTTGHHTILAVDKVLFSKQSFYLQHCWLAVHVYVRNVKTSLTHRPAERLLH